MDSAGLLPVRAHLAEDLRQVSVSLVDWSASSHVVATISSRALRGADRLETEERARWLVCFGGAVLDGCRTGVSCRFLAEDRQLTSLGQTEVNQPRYPSVPTRKGASAKSVGPTVAGG